MHIMDDTERRLLFIFVEKSTYDILKQYDSYTLHNEQ